MDNTQKQLQAAELKLLVEQYARDSIQECLLPGWSSSYTRRKLFEKINEVLGLGT